MSNERKTRRRFLADLLFAGGAVTAASVMGYMATHGPTPKPEMHPVGALPARPAPSPAVAPTPMTEMLPDGDMVAPKPVTEQCTPRLDMVPAGAPPPPNYKAQQGKRARSPRTQR